MVSKETQDKFPVGTLVAPVVDESTLEVLPQFKEATHVVIGYSDVNGVGKKIDMLRVFPLGLPPGCGLESFLDPKRAVIGGND